MLSHLRRLRSRQESPNKLQEPLRLLQVREVARFLKRAPAHARDAPEERRDGAVLRDVELPVQHERRRRTARQVWDGGPRFECAGHEEVGRAEPE